MRILIWLIIALAVVVWFKRALAGATKTIHHPGGGSNAARQAPQAETMLQCAHCGVHFPASEAVAGSSDKVYCSSEHKAIGQG